MVATATCRVRTGFTLIELLVVIAIISLLAAMILPQMSEALERGRQTACANQLRQVGLGLQMYAQDHNGYMPAVYRGYLAGDEDREQWGRILHRGDYVQDRNQFVCPSLAPHRFQNWSLLYGLTLRHGQDYDSQNFLDGLQTPSEFLTVVDSIERNVRVQFHFVHQWTGASHQPHVRHLGRATGLFADNSVRVLGINELLSLGFFFHE